MPEPEKDFYSILGAEEQAPREDIERRYKGLARRHHPDRGGDEEEMKSINEAWRVLGDPAARLAYDAGRARRARAAAYRGHTPVSSPAALADAVGGRVVGACVCVMMGLALLFLVRFQYIFFLWPLALLALFIVLLGVLMAHGALAVVRAGGGRAFTARASVWAQEIAFWSFVGVGCYGVYLVLTSG